MSFVIAAPELLSAAATDLASVGSAVGAASAAASGPTIEVLAAGADEISAAVASLFASYGQSYQAISAQASAFHQSFVQALTGGRKRVCGHRGGRRISAGTTARRHQCAFSSCVGTPPDRQRRQR